MKAAIYHEFQGDINTERLDDPHPSTNGVVIEVQATGICRSDWHGWMGHDPDIALPHVPGHELAGTIVEIGKNITNWKLGDRVTLPFVCGCGHCSHCKTGNEQICDHQFQPGFTAWGSFAEYVAIDHAQNNLVKLPDTMSFNEAASLGCRFITSFRAVVDQGKVTRGNWVVIYGCGGVGLSAIMIAKTYGAKVIAVDIDDKKLEYAQNLGADFLINSHTNKPFLADIDEITKGGAQISIDALGSKETCYNSIACLGKQGKHIQIGLMAGDQANPEIPMDLVIAKELQIIGSHGMQAHRYDAIFDLYTSGKLKLEKLIGRTVDLSTGIKELVQMNEFKSEGITIIDSF